MTSEQSAIRHGSKIGRFVVVAELGSGGMGVVYAAHDRELDRQVALKVMRGVSDDDEDRKRMLREGQAMARITHPNVITVFEVGTHQETTVFLAQELLDGGTLGKWLQDKHPPDEIIDKLVAAGRGLAAAHAAGLVHRDFKPDNVLLGKDGRVRVADFGLARSVGAFGDPAALLATAPGGGPPRGDDISITKSPLDNLTKTGAVMGTPMFMAPEQHEGHRADERSDQFAFCVVLYHALHGDWPYEGKTSVALADNVINGIRKPPPKSANVPARIRKIIDRGLATKAEDRYPSMDALLADLAYRPRAKWPLALGATVLVAGAATGAFVMMREKAKMAPAILKPAPVVVDEKLDPSVLVDALDKDNVKVTRRQLEAAAARLHDSTQAAIARASLAFVMVLGGDLAAAEQDLKGAQAKKSSDPRAAGYIDLAGAAIASARGELATAMERSSRCASSLASSDPVAGSICFQIIGETAADLDDFDAASKAYAAGRQLAERANNLERAGHIALGVAQLGDTTIEAVEAMKDSAHDNRVVACEVGALVLANRLKLAKDGDRQGALAVLRAFNLDKLESYRLKTILKLARGEVVGDEGIDEDTTGLELIEKTLQDTQKRDYWGLALEARLSRVKVMLMTNKDGAEDERVRLVEEATAKGYKRIARLAENYLK